MFIPTDRAELGRRNHQDRSTLTRNLQSLIEQGWVSEEHSTLRRCARLGGGTT
jgi:DNA-binding MarR family transcriptional regulator